MTDELQKRTGFPSIDKPWLKYYSESAKNASLPEGSLYDVLIANSKDYGEHDALQYFDTFVTYNQLIENINRTASAFVSKGVKKGDVVTICSVMTPEIIYIFYALNKIGAISDIIDPRIDSDSLVQMMSRSESRILFCLDIFYASLTSQLKGTDIEDVILISPSDSLKTVKKFLYRMSNRSKDNKLIKAESWAEFFNRNNQSISFEINHDSQSGALITHTSGTMGFPKSVLLFNTNMNAVAAQYVNAMPHEDGQRYMQIIPPFVAFGICFAIHLPLSMRMRVTVMPQFDDTKFSYYLKKYKPNHFTCTPQNWEPLLRKDEKIDLSHLLTPSVGGDYINPELESRINDYLKKNNCPSILLKGYGMTEVASSACTTNGINNELGSVGYPLVHMTISIFEPGTDKELKYNEEGEICFSGPNVMSGYYKDKEGTSKVLIKHSDGNIWMHSGDIGYMTNDGFVYVIDRLKRMIHLSNGTDILPSKVEHVIQEDSRIKQCAAVPKMTEDGNTVLRLCVVLKNNSAMNSDEIMTICQSKLQADVVPSIIEIMDHLPLTPVGKIDYHSLEEQAA